MTLGSTVAANRPIDDRILDHDHHQVVALAVERHVGEQAGGVEVLQGLVDAVGRERVARRQLHVGQHRLRLDALGSLDPDVGDRLAGKDVVGSARGEARDGDEESEGGERPAAP